MPFRFVNVNGRACLEREEAYFDLERVSDGNVSADPMIALRNLDALHEISDRLNAETPDGSLQNVILGPPVPRPRNSFGVGLNYRDHAAESAMEVPDTPVVFSKYPSCISGPFDDVELRASRGDYEAELVVVIGRRTRDVTSAESWSHVAGLMAGQDISDRELQMAAKPPHFGLGKSRDTYGPTGPALVSTDSFADPDDLRIQCHINGVLRQDARTSRLIFDIPHLVSYISAILTLEPGDLIFTGTPSGVGMADGRFLVPGDSIRTTIEGIGHMENMCR